jgi:hypothetical protein
MSHINCAYNRLCKQYLMAHQVLVRISDNLKKVTNLAISSKRHLEVLYITIGHKGSIAMSHMDYKIWWRIAPTISIILTERHPIVGSYWLGWSSVSQYYIRYSAIVLSRLLERAHTAVGQCYITQEGWSLMKLICAIEMFVFDLAFMKIILC